MTTSHNTPKCNCTQPDWYIGQIVDDFNGFIRRVTHILWPHRQCRRCGATDVKYILGSDIYTGYEWAPRSAPYCIHCCGNCNRDYPSWE